MMRRIGLLTALLVTALLSAPAVQATTAVTGYLKDASGAAVAGNAHNFLKFNLLYCGANQARVNGIAVLPGNASFSFEPDSAGHISIPALYGNDVITCGSVTGGTRWTVTYYVNNVPGPSCQYDIQGASWDLDSTTCDNAVPPPAAAPSPASAYLDLLGSNQMSGPIIPTADLTYDLGSDSAGWLIAKADAKNLSGVLLANLYPGADIGAQINAAYAALPSTGGRIRIKSGAYSFSTPIVFGTSGKGAILECDGRQACKLSYTATTGNAITFNTGYTHYQGGTGIRDLYLHGPGKATSVGVGLFIGGANGSVSSRFSNLMVDGFQDNIKWGNNAFGQIFDGLTSVDGTRMWNVPVGLTNSSDTISCIHCLFGATDGTYTTGGITVDLSGAEVHFIDTEFDAVSTAQSDGVVIYDADHWEDVGAAASIPFYVQTGGQAMINNPSFVTAVSTAPELINVTGGTATFKGGSYFNNGGAIAALANVANASNVSFLQPTLFTGFTSKASFSASTGVFSWMDSLTTSLLLDSGTGKIPAIRLAINGANEAEYRVTNNFGSNALELTNGAFTVFQSSSTTGNVNFPQSATASANLQFKGALQGATNILASTTAPTISSGFGTSPSIPNNNGTAVFTVNVGTGGTANSGVIGLPTAANGWGCSATDVTTPGANFTKQSATTVSSATLTNYNSAGTPTAWTASDVLSVRCFAY